MNVSLYQAASALQANNRWQEIIGENLSSSSTIGFKKQDVSFSSVMAGMMPQGAGANPNSVKNFTLSTAVGTTNFMPGELNVTNQPTDLAMEGPGFFEVQVPGGGTAFTRNGSFAMSPKGQLVTKAGYPVMGENGPIELDPANQGALVVSADGEIKQGAEVKGKLKVVDFNDPKLLSVTQGSYFMALNPNLAQVPVAKGTIRQGFLEASNASSLTEMSNLITAMRMYEANQKVIQTHDDRISKAINELGNTAS